MLILSKFNKRILYLVLIAAVLSIAIVYERMSSLKDGIKPRFFKESALIEVAPFYFEDTFPIQDLQTALSYSLEYLQRLDKSQLQHFGSYTVTVEKHRESIADFQEKLSELGFSKEFYKYIHSNFRFFKTASENSLVTGYFEATLKGSLQQEGSFQYPLYRHPKDLITLKVQCSPEAEYIRKIGKISDNFELVPYYTREEIDFKGKLKNQKLELAWVDNLINLYFLHVQGSGIIELQSGGTLRVNFHERNGHPFIPIGRYFKEKGILEPREISMQSIKKQLYKNPEILKEVLKTDPSYIFFRTVDRGPLGSLSVPVTRYRSIATDQKLFPKGALGIVSTDIPKFNSGLDTVEKYEKKSFFVLNQDTGGAIKETDHIDLFTGRGEESEAVAGVMKQQGTFYFIIKK
jgi:membrane-bound lytic murein transglycosylase A